VVSLVDALYVGKSLSLVASTWQSACSEERTGPPRYEKQNPT